MLLLSSEEVTWVAHGPVTGPPGLVIGLFHYVIHHPVIYPLIVCVVPGAGRATDFL